MRKFHKFITRPCKMLFLFISVFTKYVKNIGKSIKNQFNSEITLTNLATSDYLCKQLHEHISLPVHVIINKLYDYYICYFGTVFPFCEHTWKKAITKTTKNLIKSLWVTISMVTLIMLGNIENWIQAERIQIFTYCSKIYQRS